MLSIGLMSGTSMDGIDAALLETDGTPFLIQEVGSTSLDYADKFKILLKSAEYTIRQCKGDLIKARLSYSEKLNEYLVQELKIDSQILSNTLEKLAQYLYPQQTLHPKQMISLEDIFAHSTQLHCEAVKKLLTLTHYKADQIDVIGYHGQAMFHQPAQKISIIIGDGKHMAQQLGITVVNDFRQKDISLGGQGAPFAPLYHQALAIRDQKIPLAVVNCGGIANITLISSENEAELIAFDTGPGNGLIDRLVRQRTFGQENMDKDGQYGRQGKVDPAIIELLYEKSIIRHGQNYFTQSPPKALDIGDLNLIPELNALSLEDACATLEAFTADSIVSSLSLISKALPTRWVLAGGGWKNPVICEALKSRLRNKIGDQVQIFSANEIGWNNQALEAQIFAYLAVRSLQNKPLSLPGTTQVPYPVSGGQIHLRPIK